MFLIKKQDFQICDPKSNVAEIYDPIDFFSFEHSEVNKTDVIVVFYFCLYNTLANFCLVLWLHLYFQLLGLVSSQFFIQAQRILRCGIRPIITTQFGATTLNFNPNALRETISLSLQGLNAMFLGNNVVVPLLTAILPAS